MSDLDAIKAFCYTSYYVMLCRVMLSDFNGDVMLCYVMLC